MAETMTHITTTTLGSSAGSISISSIPNTFTDLYVMTRFRMDIASGNNIAYVTFNNDNGANYVYGRDSYSNGNPFSPNAAASQTKITLDYSTAGSSDPASSFGNMSMYITNYTASTGKVAQYDCEAGWSNTTTQTGCSGVGQWSGTATISTMTFTPESGNFIAGCSVSVYGILKGSGGATITAP
jgi:hypothetical protein